MNNSSPKLTPMEAKQLLAGIQQAGVEIVAALSARLTSQYSVNGKHSEDRIKAAIKAHRAAIALVWEPSPESSISAARPQRDDTGREAVP
jgi:hypothetical protein